MVPSWWRRVRELIFGTVPSHGGPARAQAWGLLKVIEEDGLPALADNELMSLVRELLTIRQLRIPLRGNTRFLSSVTSRYFRTHTLSARQRQGVLNILQRAYPHNLVVELRKGLR